MRWKGVAPRTAGCRSLRRRARVLRRLRHPGTTAGAVHAGAIRGGGRSDAPDHRFQKTKRRIRSMPPLKEMETAVMFWAGGDPAQTLEPLTRLGIRCGQLALPGE